MAIRHKRSNIAGLVPAPGEVDIGELVINYADGKIYSKNPNTNQVQLIADDTSKNSDLEAVVAIGPTPPLLNLISGKLWWDTTTGRLMIYYTDLNQSQWVEASPSAAGPSPAILRDNVKYNNLSHVQSVISNPDEGDEVYVIGQGKAIYINGQWRRSTDESTLIV